MSSTDLDGVSALAVRDISRAVSAAHLFVYLIPEAEDEAAAFGVTNRQARYFAFRSAAMGAVPWQVTSATFYNFRPQTVQSMAGVWEAATPARWQNARFVAVGRSSQRVGLRIAREHVAEARSLTDLVIAAADYAGKPLAAANASVPLPTNPLVALWQQLTVLREWRGDAHISVLANNRLGPCDCNVIHTATGRLPTGIVRQTRGWTDEEWAAATDRLARRGWLYADGTVTDAGTAARERIELETDERCTELWAPIGDSGARRLATLIAPIHEAFTAAGTFAQLT